MDVEHVTRVRGRLRERRLAERPAALSAASTTLRRRVLGHSVDADGVRLKNESCFERERTGTILNI